jgi:hypothetical protein
MFIVLLCLIGAVILLGRTNMFRFNHPKEAAKLREKRKVTPKALSLKGLLKKLISCGIIQLL